MVPLISAPTAPTREFAISLLSGEFRNAVDGLLPEIATMTSTEIELERRPTETDFLLRKNLWKQVNLAQKAQLAEIETISVYGGICSRTNFERIYKNPKRLAWLFTNPAADLERMEFGLSVGLGQLIDFLSKPVNEKTAGAFLKGIELLMNRVHGPVIQKIQAQHAHLNMNKPIASQEPPENIGERIEKLKERMVQEKNVIEVQVGDTN